MSRFEDVKQRVKEASDLVSVIEGYLPLRPRGRNLVALCPFHSEKTPSFTVFPESQHFKCFGCGQAGDVFTFVMEREGLSFRETLELLADRAGIATEGAFAAGGSAARPKKDVYGALARIAEFFAEALRGADGARAREYLRDRGLHEAVERFSLGFHPRKPGSLARFAAERGLPRDVLQQAGLIKPDGREPLYGRLIFPILDERGRVAGFGGRELDGGPVKYLNSPESPFFHKGRLLYGLWQAKRAGERRIVVVEGYTDVLACHLAGFAGAVASLGTAFTAEHGRVLRRYATEGVVLLFDGDSAGRTAAARAFEELVRTELPVRIALLGEGADPADLLAPRPGLSPDELARRRARFEELVAGAEDALVTWFRLKRRSVDLTNEANVAAVVRECGRILEGVGDPARRARLLDRMAAHLGLDPQTMRRSIASRAPRPRAAAAGQPEDRGERPAADSPETRADQELLACLLVEPGRAARVGDELFCDPAVRLLELIREAVAGDVTGRDELLRRLFTECAEDPAASRFLASCAELTEHIRDVDESLEVLLRMRRAHALRKAAQQTRFRLQKARAEGDGALVDELTRVYLQQLRDTGGPRAPAPDRFGDRIPETPPTARHGPDPLRSE